MPSAVDTHPSAGTILGKRPSPTSLSSAGIRESWDKRIREQALFSARTTSRTYLDMVRKNLAEIASGRLTPQSAEKNLRAALQNLGYRPETGFPDAETGKVPPARPASIRDLSSSQRIRLIIDTNVKQARSLGQMAVSETPAMLMTSPAWKLTRTGARKKPRGDWKRRWEAAGNATGWYGASRRELVALKTAPIWKAIGEGAGGFTDTIGTEYPPFAFGSGMAWVGVDWEDWEELCKREGMPDHLDDIAEKARRLKREMQGQEAKPDAYAETGRKKVEEKPSVPGYRPDFSSRQKADRAIDAALDEIRRHSEEVRRMADETAKREKELEEAIAESPETEDEAVPVAEKMAKYAKAIGECAVSLRSYYQRISNYGSSVATTPIPRNPLQQRAYDASMERAESSAAQTLRMAQTAFKAAKMRSDAAALSMRRIGMA